MATVTINALAPHLDGVYPLDMDFSFRDYRDIKKITGIRAGEVFESLEAGDLDIYVAMASIALRRAGVEHDPDVLFDAKPPGGIEIDFGDGEVEEGPTTSANGTPTDGSGGASGTDSKDATESSLETLTEPGSGTPLQDSTSDPATSMI